MPESFDPEAQNITKCEGDIDIALLNNPPRLRERADAIDAWNAGNPVDKFIEGKWIQLEEQTAFFFDQRYRARPTA
jgi:hypothetical protein